MPEERANSQLKDEQDLSELQPPIDELKEELEGVEVVFLIITHSTTL